ncbi:MAG TPA: hypothetical protein VFJ82_18770 [Longimicrobium sp.]|nr:hypothetical protein [Longimicrobium sp.]
MLDEAQELTLIRSVLVETFPDECQRVGKANLNDIVRRRGEVTIVPIEGASPLDWTAALLVLAGSATFINQCLSITRHLRAANHGGSDGALIHIVQQNVLNDVTQSNGDKEGRIVVVNEIEVPLPQEILDRLGPAVIDRLIAALTAHLAARDGKGD